MILPSGVKTIGNYAFCECSQLVDTNIPSTVTRVGKMAYAKGGATSMALRYLPTPAGATIADDAFAGLSFKSADSLFVMGNRPQNGVLDTGAFLFEKTDNKLSAISIAGETGEDNDKIFAFPTGADFDNDSDRRKGVAYDYIDGEAIKNKNSLTGMNVTEYDIAPGFANSTWCQNVILPKEVKTIGDNAFYNSHVKYLEMYATKIGSQAFDEPSGSPVSSEQWFYIHQEKIDGEYTTTYTVNSNNSFSTPKNGAVRNIVFENEELYNTFGKAAPSWMAKENTADSITNTKVFYQVPVNAVVNNEDSQTITLQGGDMSEVFFNDSDYSANPSMSIVTGDNTVTYTKRLNGQRFDYVKQITGEWKQVNSQNAALKAQINPTLSSMSETNWYTDDNYDVRSAISSETVVGASINIYTKN
ncbi:MAG: leucine-rich repeat domain-containing protein, partial [Clostridia bacterium]|nr:leucine-rich repeat domain-containing protein [Clostridia bacterium]